MISLIAAVAENGVIGGGNKLLWRLPDDLKRFKSLTMGHTIVMGRKTFDSIGRVLPGRTTVVVTRDRNWQHEGVRVVHELNEALIGEVFVVGGGEIYAQSIARADRLYLTHVARAFEGDAHFPDIDDKIWRVAAREKHDGELPFEFVDYVRA